MKQVLRPGACALACCFLAQMPIAAADTPRLEVVRTTVVFDGGTESAGQPGIARAKNGDLVVAFYNGYNTEIARSKDNGSSWQKPQRVADGAYTEVGITALRDGTILWPFYQEFVKEPCCQVRRYGTYVYRSGDNGLTWQGDEPIRVEMREPIPYGKIIELSDGRLLMPVWGGCTRSGRPKSRLSRMISSKNSRPRKGRSKICVRLTSICQMDSAQS